MIALMVISTAGFALFDREPSAQQPVKKVVINGFNFQKQDNFWVTTLSGQNHVFFYLPTEIENVSINITTNLQTYIGKPLYIVNGNSAKNQIDFNLLNLNYVLRTPNACTSQEECTGDFPIKDCLTDNIIIYKDSNTTEVYQENKCIYIAGEPVKGTDRFLQRILQIN